jgi:hypothetical protein
VQGGDPVLVAELAASAARPKAAAWSPSPRRHATTARSTTCVDSKRQWRNAGNICHNSAIRSVFQTIAAPVKSLGRMLRHHKEDGKQASKGAT